jgi:hypothetical protein
MNPHARSHLGVLVAFVAATLVATWPLALNLNEGVPYGGDAFQFIWNAWWFSKAANSPTLGLWFTPYQYAPDGASLALHDLSPLNAWMEAWLRPAGDFGAYNLLILFHYVLGAWGAYILAWYLTGNRAGSVIAGFIYGFSAHHAMHLSQLSTVSSGWIPLGVYYLLKYTRDGGTRDGVLSVLMLLAAALSSWYHLVFTGVVFFGFMLIGQIGLKESLGGWGKWQRAIIPWIVAVVVLSPVLVMALKAAIALPSSWRVEMGAKYFLDPAWAVLPPPNHPVCGALARPFLGTIPGNATEGVGSLGLVPIILGLLAWFRKNPTTRAWCWLGLILFLLALGPTITVLSVKTGIPGPFRLWEIIPGLNLVRVPARFVGPFTLALGLSSAGFVAGLRPLWGVDPVKRPPLNPPPMGGEVSSTLLLGNGTCEHSSSAEKMLTTSPFESRYDGISSVNDEGLNTSPPIGGGFRGGRGLAFNSKRAFLLYLLPLLILFETLVIPIPLTGSELRHPALSQLDTIYMRATGESSPPDLIVNFPTLPERTQFLYQQTIHQIPTIDGALSNPPEGARDFLFRFNWNPEFLRDIGVDLVLYQPWAAKSSLGETFRLPDTPSIPPEWRGRNVSPMVFFRDVMHYNIAYEDAGLIVFIP